MLIKRYISIFFWLFILCDTKVNSQNSLETLYPSIQNENSEFIEKTIDSILNRHLQNDAIKNAQKISNTLFFDLYKNQKYTLAKKYGEWTLELYQKNISSNDLTETRYTLGWTYYRLGDFNKAIKTFNLIISESSSKKQVARSYCEIGRSYYRLGDYFKAIEFYNKGIDLLKEQNNLEQLAIVYIDLSQIYFDIGTEKSLKKQLELLDETTKLQSKTELAQRTEYILNNEYAAHYSIPQTFNFSKAEHYYKKNLKVALKNQDTYFMCTSWNNLADIHNEAQLEGALPYLKKCLQYCKDEGSLFYTYHQIGYAYLNMNDLDKALEYINKSIAAIAPSDSDLEKPSALNFANIYDKLDLMLTFERKAEIFLENYKKQSDTTFLSKALQQFHNIDNFIDAIETETTEEESLLHWRKEASKTYSKAIHCSNLLNRPDLIFYFNEKSKALLLTEGILKNDKQAHLPKVISKKDNDFKRKIYNLENKIIEKENEKTNQDSLFNLKLNYQRFSDSLKSSFPEYYSKTSRKSLYSLSEVQESMTKNTIIIIYNWDLSKKENNITILAFSKDKTIVHNITNEYNLKQNLKTYRSLLSQPFRNKNDKVEFEKVSNTLFKILLPAEILDLIQKKELIIVPDGELQNLPFEALITDSKSKPYLIENNEISYAYSISFLRHNQSVKRHAPRDFVGFAPIIFKDQNLLKLKQTESELTNIQNIINGDIYVFDNSTKANFSSQNLDFKIIHLATHAKASEDPWIAFNDEKLKLHELYTLKNQADLVVLSACETAQGKLAQGEGVMSLARGFFYSGANSVLSSLWNVNDKSTSTIMTNFYKNLKIGNTKPEALRYAKLQYLKTSSLSEASPYYWASFVLIGDTGTVELNSNFSIFYYLLLAVIVIILFLILKKRKKLNF